MPTLYKRATPKQYRVLKIISGAVKNAADAHDVKIPKNFARSVSKRATGMLTAAKLPEALTADYPVTQAVQQARPLRSRSRRSFIPFKDAVQERGPLSLWKRSPILIAHKKIAKDMWKLKRENLAKYEAMIECLKLLDKAQKQYEKASET